MQRGATSGPPRPPPGFGPPTTASASAEAPGIGSQAAAAAAAGTTATSATSSTSVPATAAAQSGFSNAESIVDASGGVLVRGRSVFDTPGGDTSSTTPSRRPPPGFTERPLLASDGTAGYGGGEFNTTVLNRTLAAKAQKHKWNRLWGYLSPDYMSAIQMDEVATFSVTGMKIAETISQALRSLDGITEDSIITDATACVGGNAISFLRYFRVVNAIELDEARCGMLKHNLDLCLEHERLTTLSGHRFIKMGGEKDDAAEARAADRPPEELPPIIGKLNIYKGDCLQVCPQIRQDLLFLDPPWGGKQYHKRDKVVLFISKRPLAEICKTLGKTTQYLAIKVPFNADLTDLEQDSSCKFVKEVKLERMKLLVLEFANALSSDQLNFFYSFTPSQSGSA
ncbi:Trimethylguanosine synthase [Hondaea fermentalgiana]|uniref:Trimethylguanosine synthase n=1 Tax=Hondaea fermentalgiana TaxID=2315210 RepID=A0A2R5GDY1_9STRA|nr:Trimethylguanosine synthase [Hondaea fermentalgiana]|eukprot:GBG29147.1 Trimethylguanosine synthase [Hondaea fermentalgiana]